MRVTPGKVLALLVAIGCLATIAIMHGRLDSEIGNLAMLLGFALVLIWFAEALGSHVGPTFDEGMISRETPGCLLSAVGWIIMLGIAGLWYWFRIRPA
jgi:hypothetical protein